MTMVDLLMKPQPGKRDDSTRKQTTRSRKFVPRLEAERLHRRLQRVLGFDGDPINIDFYVSALTEYNPFYKTEELLEWLRALNTREYFRVEQIPLHGMRNWDVDKETGNLRHVSGGFFSIQGLVVQTNRGHIREWSQPIIHQPEIGVLGILTKKIEGILYFLVQAKAEPGNLNTFQISPTVQATRSNFMRLHGGKPTAYLNHFLEAPRSRVLIDQLQSEQGARFYKKRNRNIVIRVPDDVEVPVGPLHRWMTLGQLLKLVGEDNTVNMDARSVISCISFDPTTKNTAAAVDRDQLQVCLESSRLLGAAPSRSAVSLMLSAHSNTRPYSTLDDLVCQLTREKFESHLCSRLIPLKEVRQWNVAADEISHCQQKYFSVIGVRIEAESREVSCWDQPILKQQAEGLVGFITRSFEGVPHFLAQMRVECGNMDIVELAPTVQCITDSYNEGELPHYAENFLSPGSIKLLFEAMQSEEGGRFYRESNRNLIVSMNDEPLQETLPSYMWMTLYQLKEFIKYNNYLNVEARSLLSCLRMM
jgi:dTDP-4-dehydro-6-deoxy-alpha-D-glucopyranose 2,3-dehydratase